MKVEHTPENAYTSSVTTYSCLVDSRTKLPIASFRYNGRLYDKSGREIRRDLLRRDYLPFFALEDNCKQIRSDGAYDYLKLSGDVVRRYNGSSSQVTESGVLYPPDTWKQGNYFQQYAYSLVFGEALNTQLQTTTESWIYRAISGHVYKPELSSRWEITGGIIPDVVAERATLPIDISDYMTNSYENGQGHLVWALGRPTDIGLRTFHDGSYNGPAIDTFAGLQEDANLCTLSGMWIYPEAKQHGYQGYMETQISPEEGIRVDFRSTKTETLYSKRGSRLSFDNRFKGWYDPIYEVSVGTPRNYLFTERLHEGRQ